MLVMLIFGEFNCHSFPIVVPLTPRDRQPLQYVVNDDGKKKTTLIEWLEYNKVNRDGRDFAYRDLPKHFVLYAESKTWSGGATPSGANP
nr:DNA helicase [Tanacetum cinerariifolium]